jgi:hypothetical protein
VTVADGQTVVVGVAHNARICGRVLHPDEVAADKTLALLAVQPPGTSGCGGVIKAVHA